MDLFNRSMGAGAVALLAAGAAGLLGLGAFAVASLTDAAPPGARALVQGAAEAIGMAPAQARAPTREAAGENTSGWTPLWAAPGAANDATPPVEHAGDAAARTSGNDDDDDDDDD